LIEKNNIIDIITNIMIKSQRRK